MSQRALQQSVRRFALKQPSALTSSRFLSPSASLLQVRPASIDSKLATQIPQDESMNILANQRLQRPVSPHLTIYKPQVPWIMSGLNRITGVMLSGGLYLFSIAYVAAPVLGLQISSAAMAAGFAKWPVAVKVALKTTVALPFTYHSLNGIRHLVWDTGKTITNPLVIRTGWTVVGLTFASALGLALFV